MGAGGEKDQQRLMVGRQAGVQEAGESRERLYVEVKGGMSLGMWNDGAGHNIEIERLGRD